MRGRGISAGFPLGEPYVDPFLNDRDLFCRTTNTSFWKCCTPTFLSDVPWRHFAREDFLFDRLGPGLRFFISEQQHWSESVRPMAGLTAGFARLGRRLYKGDSGLGPSP